MKQPVRPATPRAHGRSSHYIVGEGVVTGDPVKPVSGPAATAFDRDTGRAFKFTRMLPRSTERFDPAQLDELGKAMHTDTGTQPDADSAIPSGFTYFGQFVDHDITFDKTGDIPLELLDPDEIEQGRSPGLDLDSLYGNGPEVDPDLYDDDGVTLKIGHTTPLRQPNLPGADISLPNDLPRDATRKALIGDRRNDENLAVAQMHVAFIKFHNRVVAHLREKQPDLEADRLLALARDTVIRHYQWIVLHDFLPRICDQRILHGLVGDARAMVGATAMPVEFSAAAYRLGHSMIRPEYEWNKFFRRDDGRQPATLLNLFQFTKAGGFDRERVPNQRTRDDAFRSLPSNWIVDWRNLFDFSEVGGARSVRLNHARAINTTLADPLTNIPGITDSVGGQPVPASLASRNLRRGAVLLLPTGQEACAYFNLPGLSPSEIASGSSAAVRTIVSRYGFDRRTPLWFYVLKEAELRHGGRRLGTIGSLIVAGTFASLIKGSRTSILREIDWRPSLPSHRPGTFRMTDLLQFVGDLNPLGD